MGLIKDCIGFWFICTAIVIGSVTLFCDEPAKEKFIFGASIEAFLHLSLLERIFLTIERRLLWLKLLLLCLHQ